MKSLKILVLVIIIIVSINSISFGDEVYKIITLPDGEEVKVSLSVWKNGYAYDVKFNDGNTYFYKKLGNTYSFGALSGSSNEQMEKVNKAIEIYELIHGEPRKTKNYFFSFIFLIIGIVSVLAPRVSWYLKTGWKFRNTEPSELYLLVHRIVGGILIIIAVLSFIS